MFTELGGQVAPVRGEQGPASGDYADGDQDIHPTQVNLDRPWVTSQLSSLYYDGIHAEVQLDELMYQGEDRDHAMKVTKAIKAELNRWLDTVLLVDETERVLSMGLMFKGGDAWRLEVDPADERIKHQKAADLIRPVALAPWQVVWDRECEDAKLPMIGHLRQVHKDKVKKMGDLPQGWEKHLSGMVDVVEKGWTENRKIDADNNFLWILTIDDFTASHKLEAEGKKRDLAGERSHYLVLEHMGAHPKLHLLDRDVIPYTDCAGRPMSDILPFIAEPVPHKRWDSIAPMASNHEMNMELNAAHSIMAGKFRRSCHRTVLTDEESDEIKNKIANARDGEFVTIPRGEGPIPNRYHMLDWGMVDPTSLEYLDMIRSGTDQQQTTSDFSRGKAGQYMRAETARSLTEYDRRTTGRTRRRSDAGLSRLCSMFLQVLAQVMDRLKEESIPVIIDVEVKGKPNEHEVYKLRPRDLRRRWKISIVDSTGTPGVKAERLATVQAGAPFMLELAAAADPPDEQGFSPLTQQTAKELFDEMAKLMDLSPHIRYSPLKAAAPAPPPPPSEPPVVEEAAPPVPQEGQDPDVAMESPIVGAVVEQAEAGL